MSASLQRRLYLVTLLLLVPIAGLSMHFEPYHMDGDAMAYFDLADRLRAHDWPAIVNGYWHPLYPAAIAAIQGVLHSTRTTELHAAYVLNYLIFLASAVAMVAFVDALIALRISDNSTGEHLLLRNALRLLGLGLLVIAAQRELSMGFVRPDALLQALMLAAFAALLRALAARNLVYAPLMGFFLGLAYLTKSFAFLVALLAIATMMLVQTCLQRRKLTHVAANGAFALLVFAAIAGPYIAALSHQKHRFDFGDSGALNYAWYVSGTQKMHLEPWMTANFGSAHVALVHPETQLLVHPGIYSYRAQPHGTYPPWFDPTYFHERIVPVFSAQRLLHRDARNLVLLVRYLLNHPEALILLALLLAAGARLPLKDWRQRAFWQQAFWLPPVALGLAMVAIYALVNIEERYVTLAYLLMVLPLFAALQTSRDATIATPDRCTLRATAAALCALLAFFALGETLRVALDNRRVESGLGLPTASYSPSIYSAAQALNQLGVGHGDAIACMGTIACLNDPYWMRLAGTRVLTEVDNPDPTHLFEEWHGLTNRQQVVDVLKTQGARVVVASFDPGSGPAAAGWLRLGTSNLYALPLNLALPAPLPAPARLPWNATGPEAP